MSEEEELLPESAVVPEYQMFSLVEQRHETQFSKEVLPPLPSRWSSEDPESINQQPHIIRQDSVTCQGWRSTREEAKEREKKKLKHDYYLHQFRVTSYAVLLSVHKIHKKPKTIDPQQEPLKWQRVKDLLKSLNSTVLLERRDATKALQCLQCTNKEVVSALYTTLQTDEDCVVRYEAAMALVTLSYWEEEVVLKLIQIMNVSSGQTLEDVIVTLRKSLRDWAIKPSHQRPDIKAKEKLISLLSSFMTTLRSSEMVPVQAAACLCYLNRNDQEAIDYVMSFLHDGNSYQKKQALEVVLRYLKINEPFPIQALLEQLRSSPVYKHRLKALDLLVVVGASCLEKAGQYRTVLEALEEKLWKDPILAVRRRTALVVNLLNMKRIVWEHVEHQLVEDDAELRGRAVISLSVLGLPNHRVFQTLLEMLEVDSSQYVRFQIIRTFARLHLNDVRVKRSLLNRQLGEGPLAREAHKAMRSLEHTRSYRPATFLSQHFN
ncbi:protein HEATR9-like [Heterodontus francisci]|uniref:protein HEATR9-like n=1 Tax=Heterodontus francisci TaxID=7792 RepID=UPI00355BCE46